MIEAAGADALAEWLPLALADLCAGLAALGGQRLTRSAILSGWGLRACAEAAGEAETEDEDAQWDDFCRRFQGR